jgi:hypothetical protein
MAARRNSDEVLQQAADALAVHGSQQKAACALDIPRPTFESRIREAHRRGIVSKMESPESATALKREVERLRSMLKTKDREDADLDIVKRVIGAMAGKVEQLDPPEWILKPRRQESAPGVPTLFLSDLHWGEVVHPGSINGVNKYNLHIAHERMATCVDSAIHLLKIVSPKMDYPGIVLPLGGDMISGNIHDELTATNELQSMPAVLDLYETLVGVIGKVADTFGAVFLPCVTGNHGRDTHKIWAKDRHATSFDWLLFKFLAKHFAADKRIVFYIPDGPDAYYRVYGHRYLLSHGDQFRGGDGMIGALGPIIRGDHKKRSRNAQIDMEYDTMLIGHWHSYIHLTRLIVNGSLKGYDEYAYAGNFGFEPPQQALWLTHPKYRITFRMPVYVDKRREPAKTDWVSFAGASA